MLNLHGFSSISRILLDFFHAATVSIDLFPPNIQWLASNCRKKKKTTTVPMLHLFHMERTVQIWKWIFNASFVIELNVEWKKNA